MFLKDTLAAWENRWYRAGPLLGGEHSSWRCCRGGEVVSSWTCREGEPVGFAGMREAERVEACARCLT